MLKMRHKFINQSVKTTYLAHEKNPGDFEKGMNFVETLYKAAGHKKRFLIVYFSCFQKAALQHFFIALGFKVKKKKEEERRKTTAVA
jgi:hypothetical protein